MKHRPLLLNADLGESYGAWQMGNDQQLMPLIDCANIATGFHAGDPVIMQRTVALAVEHQVLIGAHPSYPDKEGFGRRSIACSSKEITAMVIYQIGALQAFCHAQGTKLSYVKPHGALYNDMMQNQVVFHAVMAAVAAVDANLPLVVLALPKLASFHSEATTYGLTLWPEAFADRAYTSEGYLMSRSEAGSVLQDRTHILEQAHLIAKHRQVRGENGVLIDLPAITLCVHGDNPESVATVADIRSMLNEMEPNL